MTYRSAPVRVDTRLDKRKAWNRQDFKQATIKQSTTTNRSGQTTHTTIFGYRGY